MNAGKIRRMAKIEQFIAKESDDHLKTARYYRSDYLGLQLIRNFFLVTIGYLLVMALYFIRHGMAMLDHLYIQDIGRLSLGWIAGYIIVLAVYTLLTYTIYSLRYAKAQKMERFLDHQLEKMQEKYEPDSRGQK